MDVRSGVIVLNNKFLASLCFAILSEYNKLRDHNFLYIISFLDYIEVYKGSYLHSNSDRNQLLLYSSV